MKRLEHPARGVIHQGDLVLEGFVCQDSCVTRHTPVFLASPTVGRNLLFEPASNGWVRGWSLGAPVVQVFGEGARRAQSYLLMRYNWSPRVVNMVNSIILSISPGHIKYVSHVSIYIYVIY